VTATDAGRALAEWDTQEQVCVVVSVYTPARQPLSVRFSCEFSCTQDSLFVVFTADYPSDIASVIQSF